LAIKEPGVEDDPNRDVEVMLNDGAEIYGFRFGAQTGRVDDPKKHLFEPLQYAF
jgi:hypothetical protein